MKKIIGLGIVAALLLALPLAHEALAKKPAKEVVQVRICHFPGHTPVSDECQASDGTQIVGDYVMAPGWGGGQACTPDECGGEMIWVAWEAACEGKGHAADERFWDCDNYLPEG